MHVPLIVRPPVALNSGRSIADVVGLIDIAPTVAEALGLRMSSDLDGSSLLGMMGSPGSATPRHRTVVNIAGRDSLWTRQVDAVRKGRFKAIVRSEGWTRTLQGMAWQEPERELYDLVADPQEVHNLVDDQPLVYEALVEEGIDLRVDWPEQPALDDDQRRALESLGYIN